MLWFFRFSPSFVMDIFGVEEVCWRKVAFTYGPNLIYYKTKLNFDITSLQIQIKLLTTLLSS